MKTIVVVTAKLEAVPSVCTCTTKLFSFHNVLFHCSPKNGPPLQTTQYDVSHCEEANMLSSS